MEDPFVMVDFNDTALVIKSNPIIEGQYPKSLSPREMDLLTTLFTSIDVRSGQISTVRVRIQDLIKLFGLENSNSAYSRIAQYTENLMSRVIKIRDKKRNTLKMFQFLSVARYMYNEGYAEFKFNDELLPYLIELSEYAKYVLGAFLALDSFYAKRIYELVIQYKNTGVGNPRTWERTISLADIRLCLGIEKGEYEKYSHLKSRLLETARTQISERTDIHLEYEEIKLGRRVDAIRFIATENRQPPDLLRDPARARLAGQLMSCGVAEASARELALNRSDDLIVWALDELGRKVKKGEKIDNPAGWLVEAIENDWRPQQTLFDQARMTRQSEADAAAAKRQARIAEIEPIVKRVRSGYVAQVNETIRAYIESLTRDDRITIEREFGEYIKRQKGSSFVSTRFDGGDTWYSDRLVRPFSLRFLVEDRKYISIMTAEEHAKSIGVDGFGDLDAEYTALTSD